MVMAFGTGGLMPRIRGLRGGLALLGAALLTAWLAATPAPATETDPAVKFMAQVGRELMAATRTRSPSVITAVFQRYADVPYIGLVSLGTYRKALPATELIPYYSGLARFIGRYTSIEAPKYPIAKVEWVDQSVRSAQGIMVDSKITLVDGSSYEVRWLLTRHRNTFKVRDAMVGIFWVTPLLTKMFEDYIAQKGGDPRALVVVLGQN